MYAVDVLIHWSFIRLDSNGNLLVDKIQKWTNSLCVPVEYLFSSEMNGLPHVERLASQQLRVYENAN